MVALIDVKRFHRLLVKELTEMGVDAARAETAIRATIHKMGINN